MRFILKRTQSLENSRFLSIAIFFLFLFDLLDRTFYSALDSGHSYNSGKADLLS